jgi:hypothetical protein
MLIDENYEESRDILHRAYGDLQDPISLVIKTSHFAVYPYKRSIVIRQAIWYVSGHILKLVKEGWALAQHEARPQLSAQGSTSEGEDE